MTQYVSGVGNRSRPPVTVSLLLEERNPVKTKQFSTSKGSANPYCVVRGIRNRTTAMHLDCDVSGLIHGVEFVLLRAVNIVYVSCEQRDSIPRMCGISA
jgi:hypothetical protein